MAEIVSDGDMFSDLLNKINVIKSILSIHSFNKGPKIFDKLLELTELVRYWEQKYEKGDPLRIDINLLLGLKVVDAIKISSNEIRVGVEKYQDSLNDRSGCFYKYLFETIIRADGDNLKKLAKLYPGEVYAVLSATNHLELVSFEITL